MVKRAQETPSSYSVSYDSSKTKAKHNLVMDLTWPFAIDIFPFQETGSDGLIVYIDSCVADHEIYLIIVGQILWVAVSSGTGR